MPISTASWLRKLDATPLGISISEIEALIEKFVSEHFEKDPFSPKRRNPAYGKTSYTIFNLRTPLSKWLKHLETPEGLKLSRESGEELLRALIDKHLDRRPRLTIRHRPLPPNPFLDQDAATRAERVNPNQRQSKKSYAALLSSALSLIAKLLRMIYSTRRQPI